MKHRTGSRVRPRATRLIGGSSAVVLLVTGCGAGVQQVAAVDPDRSAHPVVAPGQAGSILDAVDMVLAGGVPASGTVDARLQGPYRDLARARARIDAERKRSTPEPEAVRRLRLMVPASAGWPRFFVAVGQRPSSATPELRVLRSTGARSPYALWADPQLLPGATLPLPASGEEAAILSSDAAGLVATPSEVLAGYARYLNKGAKASDSKRYRRSTYSDQVVRRVLKDRKALAKVATLTSSHRVGTERPLALRAKDGGALVIGVLQQTTTITVKRGKGKVAITDKELAALAGGDASITKKLTRTALEVVAFRVPLKGEGLITVVAARKGDVKAVAS